MDEEETPPDMSLIDDTGYPIRCPDCLGELRTTGGQYLVKVADGNYDCPLCPHAWSVLTPEQEAANQLLADQMVQSPTGIKAFIRRLSNWRS